MTMTTPNRALYLSVAVTLAISGYIHAELYTNSYRHLHVVGVLFLLQAGASFALAVLMLVGLIHRPSEIVPAAAALTALGALVGFIVSRTVGLFGFIERGLQPAPQALLTILAEVVTLALLVPIAITDWRRTRPQHPPPGDGRPIAELGP